MNKEVEDEKEECPSRLVVDLAARIYGGHIHAGRACITFRHALHCAATVVGVAQSSATLDLIERARRDPAGALAELKRSHDAFADAVDTDRRQQLADFADALKAGDGN